MKKNLLLPVAIILLSISGSVVAFDASNLPGAATSTMGNYQDALDAQTIDDDQIGTTNHGQQPTYSGVIDILEIVETTMSGVLSCLNFEVRGICVWMTCSIIPPGCSFDTSIKVKNHVPDLIFQSYDRADVEPWTESHDINTLSQGDADSSWVTTLIGMVEDFDVDSVGIQGGVSTAATKKKRANLNFKLVDAYGNPAIIAFNIMAGASSGFICESRTFPFLPHFISNLNAIAWRWDIPEMFYPQSWLPLITTWDLGTSANNYGPIYPRHGFMTAQDPLKASVLSAFRAAHVVTRTGEPHVYLTVDQPDSDGYWPSDPLDKDESDTGIWQMLYPQEDDSCQGFPYGGSPPSARRSTDGNYVWSFWKSYKCCQRKGSTLILHTG